MIKSIFNKVKRLNKIKSIKKTIVLTVSIIISMLLYNTTNSVLCDDYAMKKSSKIKTNINIIPNIKYLSVERGIGCYGGLYIFLGGGTVNLQYFFLDENLIMKKITYDLIEKQKEKWSRVSIPEYLGKWERILVNRNNSNEIIHVYGENYSNDNIIESYIYNHKSTYLIFLLIIFSVLIIMYKKNLINKKLILNFQNNSKKILIFSCLGLIFLLFIVQSLIIWLFNFIEISEILLTIIIGLDQSIYYILCFLIITSTIGLITKNEI